MSGRKAELLEAAAKAQARAADFLVRAAEAAEATAAVGGRVRSGREAQEQRRPNPAKAWTWQDRRLHEQGGPKGQEQRGRQARHGKKGSSSGRESRRGAERSGRGAHGSSSATRTRSPKARGAAAAEAGPMDEDHGWEAWRQAHAEQDAEEEQDPMRLEWCAWFRLRR